MPIIKLEEIISVDIESLILNSHNYYQSRSYLEYLINENLGGLYQISDRSDNLTYIIAKKKKSYLGVQFLWVPGGIIRCSQFKTKNSFDSRSVYACVWLGSFDASDFEDNVRINGAKSTIIVDTDKFINNYGLTKNWRKNLRRSKQAETILRKAQVEDSSAIFKNLKDLENFKGISTGINEGFIECAISNEDCISLIAEDVSGEFLGFRSVFFSKETAFDLLAVNSYAGKKVYASYLLVSELIKLAHQAEVKKFDFGGIDKVNNVSVYNFKKGSGGVEMNYCTERIMYLPNFALNVVSFIVGGKS
jgi:hypothetical protein